MLWPWQAVRRLFAPWAEYNRRHNERYAHLAKGGMDPVITKYFNPGDERSCKQFCLTLMVVVGGLMAGLGPVLGIFLVDPMIYLTLMDTQVVSYRSDCWDREKPYEVCAWNGLNVDYYFYNLTNADEWLAGTEPPKVEEVGPYSFKVDEARWNKTFVNDWREAEYSFLQWATFNPEKSCAGCNPNTTSITGVNRGYLQFLTALEGALAAVSPPMSPEQYMITQFTPVTLKNLYDAVYGFMAANVVPAYLATQPVNAATVGADLYATLQAYIPQAAIDAATVTPAFLGLLGPEPWQGVLASYANDFTVKQWVDCSIMLDAFNHGQAASAYLPVAPPPLGFPYAPELCATLTELDLTAFGFPFPPPFDPSFLSFTGLVLPYASADAFLKACIGQSTATAIDPAAAQFVGLFMTASRDVTLAVLTGVNPPLAAALSAITASQWQVLQGYITGFVPKDLVHGWGKMVFSSFLQASGGGLVTTKTVDQWLHGYVDPTMQLLIQGLYPSDWQLRPHQYTPQLASYFHNETAILDYFTQVTGTPHNYTMLSWKFSDAGKFHPFIQQKKIRTGRAAGSMASWIEEYRGLNFNNRTQGIYNMTGTSEGYSLGTSFQTKDSPYTFESMYSRVFKTEFTGEGWQQRGTLNTYKYTIAKEFLAGCNVTALAEWTSRTGFDVGAYGAAINTVADIDTYWELFRNDTAMLEYLNTTSVKNLTRYFNDLNVHRDRCMAGEHLDGVWDMSHIFAAPHWVTLGHFYNASPDFVATTGRPEDWADANFTQHGWYYAIEPFTGFSVAGYKPMQYNYLVSKTSILYPDLWVSASSGSLRGGTDFVAVPSYWLVNNWAPTDKSAKGLAMIVALKDFVFFCFTVSFPTVGNLMQWATLIYMAVSKYGRKRTKTIKKLQRSWARKTGVPKAEQAMVDALLARQAGDGSVELPKEVPMDASDSEPEEGKGKKGKKGKKEGKEKAAKAQRWGWLRRGRRVAADQAPAPQFLLGATPAGAGSDAVVTVEVQVKGGGLVSLDSMDTKLASMDSMDPGKAKVAGARLAEEEGLGDIGIRAGPASSSSSAPPSVPGLPTEGYPTAHSAGPSGSQQGWASSAAASSTAGTGVALAGSSVGANPAALDGNRRGGAATGAISGPLRRRTTSNQVEHQ